MSRIATVRDLAAAYLASVRARPTRHCWGSEAQAARRLIECLGKEELDALLPCHWQAVKDAIRARGTKPTTQKKTLEVCRKIFKFGYLRGHLAYDVWRFLNDEPAFFYLQPDPYYTGWTFGDLLARFSFAHLHYYAKDTRKQLRRFIRHFSPTEVAARLSALTQSDVYDFCRTIAHGHSPNAACVVKKYVLIMRTVFRWGYLQKIVPTAIYNLARDVDAVEFARSVTTKF